MPDEDLLNPQERIENQALEQVREAVHVQRLSSKLSNNRSVSKGKISITDLKRKIE